MKDAYNRKVTFSLRPAKHFFTMLIAVLGVVLVWRGVWELVDLYVFPDNRLLSSLVSILVGLIILYLPDQDIKELL